MHNKHNNILKTVLKLEEKKSRGAPLVSPKPIFVHNTRN